MQRRLTDAGIELLWYDIASDRFAWNSMELAYVARAMRKSVETIEEHAAPCRFLILFEADG